MLNSLCKKIAIKGGERRRVRALYSTVRIKKSYVKTGPQRFTKKPVASVNRNVIFVECKLSLCIVYFPKGT